MVQIGRPVVVLIGSISTVVAIKHDLSVVPVLEGTMGTNPSRPQIAIISPLRALRSAPRTLCRNAVVAVPPAFAGGRLPGKAVLCCGTAFLKRRARRAKRRGRRVDHTATCSRGGLAPIGVTVVRSGQGRPIARGNRVRITSRLSVRESASVNAGCLKNSYYRQPVDVVTALKMCQDSQIQPGLSKTGWPGAYELPQGKVRPDGQESP